MSSPLLIRPAGTVALLIDCGDLDSARRVFAALNAARECDELSVSELIPGAETVLVTGGEARDGSRLAPKLRRIIASAAAGELRAPAPVEEIIPVHYGGEDLDEVAALVGMTPQEVIGRHVAARYTVAFTGFAPGFAYLSGGDPRLEVPRRSTPRPRIPPGSVGLAGRFTGIYPRESPGGWQIIGRTARVMWDTDREQPAALLTGGTVRFVAERQTIVGSGRVPRSRQSMRTVDRPVLRVIEPGLQSVIEDEGRHGVAGMGVGESGAAPRHAYRRANRLAGNRAGLQNSRLWIMQ